MNKIDIKIKELDWHEDKSAGFELYKSNFLLNNLSAECYIRYIIAKLDDEKYIVCCRNIKDMIDALSLLHSAFARKIETLEEAKQIAQYNFNSAILRYIIEDEGDGK